METITDIIIYAFAFFGFICAVVILMFYHILKADSKMPTKAELYAAEKERQEYAQD